MEGRFARHELYQRKGEMTSRLSHISKQLSRSENIGSAIQILALNIGMTGKSVRCFMGKFHENLEIFHVASFGIKTDINSIERYSSLLEMEKVSQAFKSKNPIIHVHDSDYLEKLARYFGTNLEEECLVSIYLPLDANHLLVVSMRESDPVDLEQEEYFLVLQSILNLLFRIPGFVRIKSQANSPTSEPIFGSRLNERQELILEMIRNGDTNAKIASEMGYSESLIRQETILIYKKLGVRGRKDLEIESSHRDDFD